MNNKLSVFIAGDSTVQTYSRDEYPQAGWGQFIDQYFIDFIQFHNHAIGGRSSKTFVEEGRLEKIKTELNSGDYLFIQMGHNDATVSRPERYTTPFGSYKEYLQKYVETAKEKNAIPILITPVARLHYENKQFINDFPEYCIAMKQVAIDNDILLIDLMEESLKYYQTLGYDRVLKYYMASVNETDFTHFTELGAKEISRIIALNIKKLPTKLSEYVVL